jgi:hypothetical protein
MSACSSAASMILGIEWCDVLSAADNAMLSWPALMRWPGIEAHSHWGIARFPFGWHDIPRKAGAPKAAQNDPRNVSIDARFQPRRIRSARFLRQFSGPPKLG